LLTEYNINFNLHVIICYKLCCTKYYKIADIRGRKCGFTLYVIFLWPTEYKHCCIL